ncbi:Pentatricopeptide repeat-containing protein [Thalictrum thalictroides]|uniref:Pentatricopeptide repeat-containing protein n=1 Tax=Thalictrum thalictroides TaxID=46969 RepID=A0A7J6XEC7_THATH|nr:Pentatricopeptide repeat-containing protein [Thalictrum thalictroides]
MLRNGVMPDYLTFPFLAKACARLSSLRLGLGLHSCIFKSGFEFDLYVRNSLIHMYSSCGDIISAKNLFDDMPHRNSVSWNSIIDGYAKCGDMVSSREIFELMPGRDVVSWSCMIDGYVKSGDHREALEIFKRMRLSGIKANEVTMVSVLCACAHLGALEQGKTMHKYVKDNGLPMTLVLRTSLVDMYAKCGSIQEALSVFRGLCLSRSDVLLWNAIIGGLATHGFVVESLELFTEMQKTKVTPDEITYLCLLNACAHGGLVEGAWHFFNSLSIHGMTPMLEHYACMVDVLGRAGHLDDAYEFLNRMPVEPTASMLGALLSGCLNHGRVDIGEIVGKRLIELDPEHDGRYVGLSNVYAVARRWEDAKTLRKAMEKKGVKKSPGFSSVEVDGELHKFIAHDKIHPQLTQLYSMLNVIAEEMKLDCNNIIQGHSLANIEDIG